MTRLCTKCSCGHSLSRRRSVLQLTCKGILSLPIVVDNVLRCSYNKINQTQACQNSKILNGLLKEELDFQGFIMSDWAAMINGVQPVRKAMLVFLISTKLLHISGPSRIGYEYARFHGLWFRESRRSCKPSPQAHLISNFLRILQPLSTVSGVLISSKLLTMVQSLSRESTTWLLAFSRHTTNLAKMKTTHQSTLTSITALA